MTDTATTGTARTGSYDLVVIGGGAGGLIAAREGHRRGARTLLVEAGPVGGDCTFTGCVPSKALLAAAAEHTGFDVAMARVHQAVERIAATEDDVALKAEGIDVLHGFARFTSPSSIGVDGVDISAPRFVVATGSRPALPAIPGLRELPPLTNETIFDLGKQPASIVVLGAGAIGCELAQAFARLGTTVTIVEAGDRILPEEEPETSRAITDALVADGVTVRTGETVVRVGRLANGDAHVDLAGDTSVTAAKLLAALGREPAGAGLGLEEIGVDVDDTGAIGVDPTMATGVKGIWAVGDVIGGPQFTHAAARMGWVAAANALAPRVRIHRHRFDPTAMPWATFTHPEVGRVGLTEAQAADTHAGAQVAYLPLSEVDRAVATGADHGFVKLIAAPRRMIGNLGGGRLVGATIVADRGGDIVHEAAIAMQADLFVGRLAQTTHVYPSWAMAVQQTALQFFANSTGHRARRARRHASG